MSHTARESAKPLQPGTEDGSGTVLALGLGVVLILGLVLLAMLAQAAALASRAASAADLSALAAADAARGLLRGDPCRIAFEVASRHGAIVESCVLTGAGGEIAEVRTVVAGSLGIGTGKARARAGPPPGNGW
ncbi:Rv3654c family TadE-like protein [Arthrobacter sp. NPDC090010]|uniref:Rv3654c family TadE-like protein n=1 Tax=Arthrobacter sp. NPDC090010 TaxID=3363942 RepID=UPI0037FD1578